MSGSGGAAGPPGGPRPPRRRLFGDRIGSVEVLAFLLIGLVIFREPLANLISDPRLQTWTTVFVSVMVQAMPFLVFGVVLSAVIAVFVPRSFWAKALPKHPALAVPVASAAGVVLPGCECGSVPIAGSLIRRGVAPAAALAFLLAAPAINPIVLVATAVAFPNNPEMVVGRGVASLLVAVVMGWLWLRLGRTDWIRLPHRPDLDDLSRARAFWAAVRHDIMHAGGFLVIGAMAAASINVLVPERWLQTLADNPVLSILALAVLAVLLSICSEADAFVAASLSQFSLTSRLVFLVVGPMVDLKLVSMQAGTFGRRFAYRFAPATFLIAVVVAVAVGTVLL
ncbi:permease [Solwaraspora sp. WMMB762]|uniref:permease n=1 Tax=Solwaraspora sp. WMMB762 TaxID=3404120 RepID=UPI003B96209C